MSLFSLIILSDLTLSSSFSWCPFLMAQKSAAGIAAHRANARKRLSLTQWDAAKFELTFAVRDREGKAAVNVIYANKLRPDNFKDGGNVFVEGKYDTKRNLIVASKLQTKCASKYEAAEGVTARTGGVEKSDY